MGTVTVFNGSQLDVTISVNNGPQSQVAAARAPSWTPQSPAAGGPSWSNTTRGQGVFAPGANYLAITPQGAMQPLTVKVNIPQSIQWTAMQLYFFFNGYGDVAWMLLNQGQFITGNIALSMMQATDGG